MKTSMQALKDEIWYEIVKFDYDEDYPAQYVRRNIINAISEKLIKFERKIDDQMQRAKERIKIDRKEKMNINAIAEDGYIAGLNYAKILLQNFIDESKDVSHKDPLKDTNKAIEKLPFNSSMFNSTKEKILVDIKENEIYYKEEEEEARRLGEVEGKFEYHGVQIGLNIAKEIIKQYLK
jgi:hypothetical protein